MRLLPGQAWTDVCCDIVRILRCTSKGTVISSGSPSTATAKCTKAADDGASNQVCGKCVGQTFMYKGGCYDKAEETSNLICTDAAYGTVGVCTTCKTDNGYFNNPGAANNVDSCISCGDTTGVTIGENPDSKTYKGVDGCKTCTLSDPATTATCTECATGFLHTSSGSTSCVAECPKGYFGHTSDAQKKTCQSCSTASGLNPSVTGIEGCTSCIYTESGPSVLTCSECENGKKPSLDGLHCYACAVGNCASCNSEGACQKCISDYILDGDACTQQTCSTPDCKTCNNPKAPSEACTECVTGMFLTPTGQCISDCTALSGYYGDAASKTCKRCDPSCAECVGAGANQCSACPAGRALRYAGSDPSNGGSCGEQCAVSADGVRAANANARASICTSNNNGGCTGCAEGYFLLDGGCYKTDR